MSIVKLRKMVSECYTVEDYVKLAYSFHVGTLDIIPSQVKDEIIQLLKLVADLPPRLICEIGTANGGTLFLFSRVAASDATLISIDLPGGRFGGGYPKWKVPLYHSFASSDQKICLLRMDSHDEATLRKVKKILGDRELDFLFIDGDHSYEGVKKDFEMYSTSVRRGEG